MTADRAPPVLPAIVALLDARFQPSSVQVTQTEWTAWATSNDAEIRQRLHEQLVPIAVHLTAREWPALRALILATLATTEQRDAEALEQEPPYATHAAIQRVREPLRSLILRFRSANSCTVDRIHVPREEWPALRAQALTRHEADVLTHRAAAAATAHDRRRPGAGFTP